MKSVASASFRAAGAFGDERDDEPVCDAQVIRQWWSTYLWILQLHDRDVSHLFPITDECVKRGIVKEGLPMPRTGSDDLAKECGEIKDRQAKQEGWRP